LLPLFIVTAVVGKRRKNRLKVTAVPNGEKVLKKVPSKVPLPEKWMGE